MGSVEFDERERDRVEQALISADEQSRKVRQWNATEEIQNPASLAKLIEDESLAYNLAGIMGELDNAIRDVNLIQREYSAPDHVLYGIRAVLRNAAGLQRILFNLAMGDE